MNFGFFAVGDSVFCQCVTICIPLFETGQSYSVVMGGKFECILQFLNDTALNEITSTSSPVWVPMGQTSSKIMDFEK